MRELSRISATEGETAASAASRSRLPLTRELSAELTEGETLRHRVNIFAYASEIAVDINIADPQYRQVHGFKLSYSNGIFSRLFCDVVPSSIKLNPASLEMGAGEAMRLDYTLSKGSAGSVSFESSSPEIAAVSPDGMITAVSPGSATITATTYNGRKASAKITVLAAPESIAIERWGDPLRLGLGESGTLSVIFSPGSGGSYSFESSDSDVVEIDSSGKFRAKMLGDCTNS